MKTLFVFALSLMVLASCEDANTPSYHDADGIPTPTHSFVNDFTNTMLSAQQKAALEKRLQDYQDSTSTQLVVICVPSMPSNKNGDEWPLEELVNKTFRTWKIGTKEKNNGILLFISLEEHKSRIETGYGAEGALPDGICGTILRQDIAPLFKEEKYYEGIDLAITDIEKSMKGEFTATAASKEESSDTFWLYLLIGCGVCAIIGAIFSPLAGGIMGGVYSSGYYFLLSPDADLFVCALAFIVAGVACWLMSWIFRGMALSSGGGSGDSFFSGSDSGGSSSGGFSGDGGSSGGGGASGGW